MHINKKCIRHYSNIKELDLAKLGPYASQIAKMEGLDAHANSIDVRLERMQ